MSAEPTASVDRLATMVNGTSKQWRSLLEALDPCADCNAVATRSDGIRHFCDRHGGAQTEELEHAAIIRAVTLCVEQA